VETSTGSQTGFQIFILLVVPFTLSSSLPLQQVYWARTTTTKNLCH